MRTSELQVMKRIAAERFVMHDVAFDGFEKIDMTEVTQVIDDETDLDSQVEVWAKFTLKYDGEPPESYRTLNAMIMDWVDSNENRIRVLVNKQLIPFLKEQYKDIDVSDLDDKIDDYIWEDQVDYMPEVDEANRKITFVLELVLDIEDKDLDD